ncbi:MAG: hypothetical protein JWR26_706 [Pedosphaera sp.]|nr:hypothetical protein [Pedosphaera sp.]
MGLFKKKPDPISDRARALTEEIAALEAQIKRLDSKLDSKPDSGPPPPRLRSTAMPHGASTVVHSPQPPAPAPVPTEPIFEEVDQNRLKAKAEPATTPEHFNELGVRKYDLAAFFRRIKNHFRGPSTANPKLVNYLAAGSIQGLRPMRYEKRVARNRFLFLFVGVLLLLLGIFAMFFRHR